MPDGLDNVYLGVVAVVDRSASGLVFVIAQQIAKLAGAFDPGGIVALEIEARGQTSPAGKALKYDALFARRGAVGRFDPTKQIDRRQVGLELRGRPP